MIAKVAEKPKKKSSFKGLADYLTGIKKLADYMTSKGERVETSFFINCSFDDPDLNIKEIRATQMLVTSTKGDKTYHFIVSLREGETLNKDEMHRVVNMQLKALGFEKHQAFVAAHRDTANFHLHIAVNKIHPETHKVISPYKDFEKLDRTCGKLEQILGLQADNRIGKNQDKQKPKTLHSGKQSFQEWVTDFIPDISDKLEKAKTWKELHHGLAIYNLELRKRGAGLVISDRENKFFMKASTVGRSMSKKALEIRFGEFERADIESLPKARIRYEGMPKGIEKDNPLYVEYLEQQEQRKAARAEKLAQLSVQQKVHLVELKDWYEKSKTELEKDIFITPKLKNMVLQDHRKKFEDFFNRTKKERQAVYKQYNTFSWNDFLLAEGRRGRADALKILRAKSKKQDGDNFITVKNSRFIVPGFNKVSRYGEMVYQCGEIQIRDNGNKITFYGNLADANGLSKAMSIIAGKKGKNLSIIGSPLFKGQVSNVLKDQPEMGLEIRNLEKGQGRGAAQGR